MNLKEIMMFFINKIFYFFTSLVNIDHPFYKTFLYQIIYGISKVQIVTGKIRRRIFPFIYIVSTSFSRILQKYNIISNQDFVYSIEFYKSDKLIVKKSISYTDLTKKYNSIALYHMANIMLTLG